MKLVSRESSGADSSSFRDRVLYYGSGAGAIPFMWESEPGTPKHQLSDSCPIPPLTPPPSYHSSKSMPIVGFSHSSPPKSTLIGTILSRSRKKKIHFSPSSSVSSGSSSSWSSGTDPTCRTLSSSSTTRVRSPTPMLTCCVGGGSVTWKRLLGASRR